MVKVLISFCLLICMSFAIIPSFSFADETLASEEGAGNVIINRGIFGCVYQCVVGVFKVGEAIVFGRYGVRGLADYFRVDKLFHETKPRY